MYYMRQWTFVSDMNYDGAITISDIWLWVKWLYFYPGDGFFYVLLHKMIDIANFLEITYSDYGGLLSGIISFYFWIFFVGIFMTK